MKSRPDRTPTGLACIQTPTIHFANMDCLRKILLPWIHGTARRDRPQFSQHRVPLMTTSDYEMISELFEREVPEVSAGIVQIRAIARGRIAD